MTYQGALLELSKIAEAKDLPFYYKPLIKEIIHVFKYDVIPVELIKEKNYDTEK